MAIRFPLQTVLYSDNSTEVGAGSVSGGVRLPFTIPQDTDGVVVKFMASVAGTGVSATLQTTDDGGTTWYDVARTSIVSNANGTTAVWCAGPVVSAGMATAQNGFPTASLLTVGIRSTAASTLATNQVSGLPMLSQTARVLLIINGNITSAASNSLITEVLVNSQSATA